MQAGERHDKSIVTIQCVHTSCIYSLEMTCRHFTLFTLRSGKSGLEFCTTRRDVANGANKVVGELFPLFCHNVYGIYTIVLKLTNAYVYGMLVQSLSLTKTY